MTLLAKAIKHKREKTPIRVRCVKSSTKHFKVGDIYTGKVGSIGNNSVFIDVNGAHIQMCRKKFSKYGVFRFVLMPDLA